MKQCSCFVGDHSMRYESIEYNFINPVRYQQFHALDAVYTCKRRMMFAKTSVRRPLLWVIPFHCPSKATNLDRPHKLTSFPWRNFYTESELHMKNYKTLQRNYLSIRLRVRFDYFEIYFLFMLKRRKPQRALKIFTDWFLTEPVYFKRNSTSPYCEGTCDF